MGPKPPAPLVDHIKQGKCVLFAGAGLSMQAGLPSWTALLRDIVERLPNLKPDESAELTTLLDRGKLLDVAEYCKLKEPFQFISVLEERLRGADCVVPDTHRIVARIPFTGVVTTNYDKLLERGWRMEQSGEPKLLTHADTPALGKLLLGGSYFVLKAHGDIDRPKTIVLTAKDYQEVIHANPAFESVFSAILLTRVILFVGYSLNDPDFALLLERPLRRFEDLVRPRYALMTDIGPIEADVLYRTSGVQVIPYENVDGTHQEVIGFLRQLERATALVATQKSDGTELPRVPVFQPTPRTAKPVSLQLSYDGVQVLSLLSHGAERTFGSARPAPDWHDLRNAVQQAISEWDRKPASIDPLGARLTQMIDADVIDYLKELPDDTVVNLRIGSELQDLPWEWIQIPSYTGTQFLNQRNPVVRQLLNAWESLGCPGFGSHLKILLVADTTPQSPLPWALEEANRIGAMFKESGRKTQITSLFGAEATYENLAESVRSQRYDIIHFAGHAWFDAQTSFLILANEEVLRAPELGDLLRSHPPAVLFLNSHFTSFVPRGMETAAAKAHPDTFSSSGSGYLGFAQGAAGAGVGAFLGTCYDKLSDKGAKELAVRMYAELLKGATVAKALLEASRTAAAKSGNLEGLFYNLVGQPDLVLPAVSGN